MPTRRFFSAGMQLSGEEEVREAYYAYSVLGCDEQMWDHEGKEVDVYVVPKLLSQHSAFFRKKKLGRQVRLTLRVPNPARERGSAKGLLEILESIPRSFDVARQFYRQDIAPIFEIILPMTTGAVELNRIWNYYREYVAGKSDQPVLPGDITFKEWIGDFAPKTINVIPLIEDKPSMINADGIVEEYLRGKDAGYQRVFLALDGNGRPPGRLPDGTNGAFHQLLRVIKFKRRLDGEGLDRRITAEARLHVGRFEIAPKGGRTETHNGINRDAGLLFQPMQLVKSNFKKQNGRRGTVSHRRIGAGEEHVMALIDKMSATYSRQVERLTTLINDMARHVPPRRKRKLHTGLFGYTRAVAGKRLPRAISFTAALYSLGLPPELLGLADLKTAELKLIVEHFPNFYDDMKDALAYFDPQCLSILPPRIADDIRRTLRSLKVDIAPDLIHQSLTRAMRNLLQKNEPESMPDLITQAARERRFLG